MGGVAAVVMGAIVRAKVERQSDSTCVRCGARRGLEHARNESSCETRQWPAERRRSARAICANEWRWIVVYERAWVWACFGRVIYAS